MDEALDFTLGINRNRRGSKQRESCWKRKERLSAALLGEEGLDFFPNTNALLYSFPYVLVMH